MLRKVTLFLAALALYPVGSASAQSANPAPAPAPSATAPLDAKPGRGRVEFAAFDSAALGKRVGFSVYLPPSYESKPESRFPLIVFLHGLWEDEKRWTLPRHGLEILEQVLSENKIGEVILAVPNADRGMGFYTNAKEAATARYEDLIYQDFIPYLDANYRTLAERKSRAILGSSMGGYGAIKIAFKHPELFCAVAAHSAAIYSEQVKDLPDYAQKMLTSPQSLRPFGSPIDEEYWRANNLLSMAGSGSVPKDLKIYFDCGEQDRFGFQKGAQALHDALQKANIPHEFAIRPGDHGWEFINKNLHRSLEFLYKSFHSAS